MSTKKRIFAKFEIKGQKYEAVRVFRKGEPYLLGEVVMERVPDAYPLLVEELWEHRHKFPAELESYMLVTAPFYPAFPDYNPGRVLCFYHDHDGWHRGWAWLGRDWRRRCLVLRRAARTEKELRALKR